MAAGSTVAIVVDDPSRWTPVREALPIVLKRLHAAGVRHEDVTISVGVGRHAPVDADAMRRRVGEEIAAGYRCFSPPVDDLSAYDDLGQTPQGIPVRIFRPVARANLRILIGSVLPHLQAGFGGGYKLIFPGTSHRTTLGALHRQGIDGRSDPAGSAGGPCGGQRDAAGDPRGGSAVGPVLVDQPPRRRARAGVSDRRRASRTGAGYPGGGSQATASGTRGSAGGPGRRGKRSLAGRPDAELQGAASSSRGSAPGECSPDCSGPTRTRSTARSRSMRLGASPQRADGGGGPFGGSCRGRRHARGLPDRRQPS